MLDNSEYRRIGLTFDAASVAQLANLAALEQKTVAGLAKELVFEALERREDMALSKLADKRDQPNAKHISHADAWK